MKPHALLKRLASARQNIRFADALALARALGFHEARIEGSHHILVHPKVREPLNLQNAGGQAKAYQLGQLLELVERYNLKLEEEP